MEQKFVSDVNFERNVTIGEELTIQGVSISAVGNSLYVGGIELAGDGIQSANNLSDLTNYDNARSNLGLEIGVDVQAYNAVLQDISISGGFTGEVTGTGSDLTLQSSAITDKTTVNAGLSDYVLVADSSDSNNLKKVFVSSIASASGGITQFAQMSDIIGSGLDSVTWGDIYSNFNTVSTNYEGLTIQDSKAALALGEVGDDNPKLLLSAVGTSPGILFSEANGTKTSSIYFDITNDLVVLNADIVIGSTSGNTLRFAGDAQAINQVRTSFDGLLSTDNSILVTAGAVIDYVAIAGSGDVSQTGLISNNTMAIWDADKTVKSDSRFAINTTNKTLTIQPTNSTTVGLSIVDNSDTPTKTNITPSGLTSTDGTNTAKLELSDGGSGFSLSGYITIGDVSLSNVSNSTSESGATSVLTANATKTWVSDNNRKILFNGGATVANGADINLEYDKSNDLDATIMLVTVYYGTNILSASSTTFTFDLVNKEFRDVTEGQTVVSITTSVTNFASNFLSIQDDTVNDYFILSNLSGQTVSISYQVI